MLCRNNTLWLLGVADDAPPVIPAVRTTSFEPLDFREDESDIQVVHSSCPLQQMPLSCCRMHLL